MSVLPDTAGIRILLVDDSRPMRILVREMLRALGMPLCHESDNADDAMAQLCLREPDIIITELAFDHADGLDLVRHIRGHHNPLIARAAIVAMSGRAEHWRVRAAASAGVNAFLVKPLSAKALADHVSYALGHGEPLLRTIASYDAPANISVTGFLAFQEG